MAVTYTTYQIPGNFTTPNAITVGPDKNIWFTVPAFSQFATQQAAIGMLNLSTGIITEYPITSAAGSTPSSIVSGPGGDLWFVEQTDVAGIKTSYIASIDPTTGVINEYPITIPGATPAGLAVGSDGNLWFTDSANNAVGVFNPSTHTSTEVALPSGTDDPGVITPGPDGNLWFAAYLPSVFDHAIADINPTTDAITFSVLPNINAVPLSITAGPNGTVWFTEQFGSNVFTGTYKIASISTSTHAITEYAGGDGSAGGITTGPDSNIWSDASSYLGGDTIDNTLSQLDPTTEASSSSPLPLPPFSGQTIVTGPDDNLYIVTQGYIVSAHLVPADQSGLTGTVTEDATGTGKSTNILSGQTVYIDLNHDGKIDPGDPTTITDGLGDYTFSGLAPGTYTVSVAPYPGTIVTFPTGGSQTLTVAGGQVGTVGALGVIPSSSLLPLTFSATLFGTGNTDVQTAEVNALYRSILGRAPDPTGGANAIAYLKSGGSVGQLSGDLLTSPEYDGDCVQSFYSNYLDRAPTMPELTAGITFLQGGGTQDQLATQLFDSAEFNTLFATNTAFVQQLYIDILGREPAGTELSNWLSMLSTGTTRPEVVTDLISSTESDQRAVSGQFDILFGNSSNEPLQSTFVSLLQNGLTQIDVAVSLYSELAFISRANATIS
jgi:hypothetical protein